jgi:hypothetical protein
MPARDDAGSNYGRPGGSQNSGVHNGGVAGGMGGGFGGGGAGRNAGAGSRFGMTTGTKMNGNTYVGRPGGIGVSLADVVAAAARPKAVSPVAPTSVPPPTVVPVSAPVPVGAALPPRPASLGWLPGWPGTGQWWGNQGPWNNDANMWPRSNGSTSYRQPGNVRYPGGQTQLKNGSTLPAPTGKEEIF